MTWAIASTLATRDINADAFDAVVAVTTALMIAARRVDIVQHHGRTAGDEPATLADWRRYTVLLLVVTAAAWSVAHVIAGNLP